MRAPKVVLFIVLMSMIFSIWVAFALLVINPHLHPYIPGYKVGSPCGWEIVALILSIGTAYLIMRKWPAPEVTTIKGVRHILLNSKFIFFSLFYMAVGIIIFLWQYYLFTLKFL